MDRKNVQRIEMLGRVVEFGATHLELFPKDTLAGRSFAALGAALSNLSENASIQVSTRSGVRTTSKVRNAAREAVYRQMRQISDTADALAIDASELTGRFRIGSYSDRELIHMGRAFARDAEPLKKEFVQHRMPNDFIDKLNAAVDDLEESIREQGSFKSRRAKGNTLVDETLAECQTLLRRLDAVVENTVVDKPPLKSEWDAVRHVRRVSSRSEAPDPSPESTAPTPAA